MDPQLRILLEVSYEAIVESGSINYSLLISIRSEHMCI